MKAVLISIQPKWVEKIASGEKTIEVRKSRPKLKTPFKVYIYCTKGKPTFEQSAFCDEISNGKVIGEFVCDRIDEFTPSELGVKCKRFEALHETRLTVTEIREYLKGNTGYGWHISDLKIYDKPKELSEFRKPCPYTDGTYCIENKCEYYGSWTGVCRRWVERPPQSWCYVEELK